MNTVKSAGKTGALYHDYVLSKSRNAGKVHQITLHEMIHIGPSKFYNYRENQFAAAHSQGSVIQIEGMKAPHDVSVMLNKLYTFLAEVTGLHMQKKPNTPYEVADVTYDSLSIKDKAVFNCFVAALKVGAKLLSVALESNGSDKIAEQIRHTIVSENLDSSKKSILNIFNSTILTTRNRYAVECAVNTEQNVSMVWGKAHAKGIIEMLKHQGYTMVSTSAIDMADFV